METIRALTLVAACVTATACSSKGGSTAPPPDPVVSLALHGGDFSCAVLASGAVRCWGTNISGQLGNAVGLGSESAAPVSAGVSAPVKLAAGGVHTCAALASGSVSCWGYGGHGELGNGSFDNSMTPATVTGLAHPLDLSAGLYHACALVSGGTVKCWGDNEWGQLGDPDLATTAPNNRYPDPVTVPSLAGAQVIAAGGYQSCALLDDATVKCWGGPMNGPLPYQNDPVTITSLTGVLSFAAGSGHNCAVISGGRVKCWGKNASGELGIGDRNDRPTEAASVTSIDSAGAVAAGSQFSCALIAGGAVACWGNNERGQLGDGTYTQYRLTPVTVAGLTGATAIATGRAHACALVTGGRVKCWGDNMSGQLGLDPNLVQTSAVPVTVGF